MKKTLLLLIMILLTGCTGVITNGNRELTLEQVQQFAQQTMTARVSETQGNPLSTPAAQSGLLIRPVQQTDGSTSNSGVTVLSTPEDNIVINRPGIQIPTSIPTAIPTVPVFGNPFYAEPTKTPYYAQQVGTVCERARFVDDVTIPDNTVMSPGQVFRKTWRIQNAGSCAWSPGYQLVYTGGEQMGTVTAVNLPGAVAPGQTVDVSVDLRAPYAYGSFQSNWNLRSPSGNIFGTSNSENDSIWVKIVVATDANMSTVAPGVTPVNSSCSLIAVNPAYRAAFKPGEETDFYFRVRNMSYSAWTTADMDIAYISGENMLKRKDQVRKDLPYEVAPGGTLEYYLDATAPNYPGTYTMTMGIVRGYEVLCSMDVTITVTY